MIDSYRSYVPFWLHGVAVAELRPVTITTKTNHRNRNNPIYREILKAECGGFGVMKVPEGMPESEGQHCAARPSFLNLSLLPDFAGLAEKEAKVADEGGVILSIRAPVCAQKVELVPCGCDCNLISVKGYS